MNHAMTRKPSGAGYFWKLLLLSSFLGTYTVGVVSVRAQISPNEARRINNNLANDAVAVCPPE